MFSGVIGFILFMGVILGGVMGLIGVQILLDQVLLVGLYVMFGMGVMMGVVLQVLLVVLMVLLELIWNFNIILFGMLIIIMFSLVISEVFGKKLLFLIILKSQGLSYQNLLVIQVLCCVFVGVIMDCSILCIECYLIVEEVCKVLKFEFRWLIVEGSNGFIIVMLVVDFVCYLEDNEFMKIDEGYEELEFVDLMNILVNCWDVVLVQYQVMFEEVLNEFDIINVEVLYV